MRFASGVVVVAAAAVSLTCSESAGPDPNAVAVVVITPDSTSFDTGDSLQLSAVARNAEGTALSGKTFAWSTLDPALVTVSNSGWVRGRWPGTARVVATSEEKSDTARVLLIPKIDSIALTAALDTLRSLGDPDTLTVVAYIGTQAYNGGGEYTWEMSDSTFLFLSGGPATSRTRTARARANGTTIVRVREARGASDSARVVVRQRVVSFQLISHSPSAAYRGCPVRPIVLGRDANGIFVLDAVLHWSSTDTTLARIDSTGLITPRAAGVDTIVVTSDGASYRFPFPIEAAPVMPLYLSSVSGEPAGTVGQKQYAIGQGKVSYPEGGLAPATYRIVSSDTLIAIVTPAETAVSTLYPFFSEPVRVIGRGVGEVTLTPYMCDVQAPPVTLRVTRPHLTQVTALPANARTDDGPSFVFIYTQDSAGVTHYPAEPVTVHVTTTDTTVMRSDSSARHLATGSPATFVYVSYLEPGSARLVVADSAGVYVPDSSGLVEIAFPPLFLQRVGDTLHLGMRQHAFVPWDPMYVYVDRIVAGAPLHVTLPTSDSAVARVIPAAVDIPVGNTGLPIEIASGDVRGVATISAHAARHTDARTVVVVGRPALQWSQFGGVLYPGDSGRVQVIAVDSTTQFPRVAAETLVVSVASSDTTVVALDSATLMIAAGNATATSTGIRFKAPGTATITASDPRAVPYAYSPASLSVTVTAPSLIADSVVSLGVDQQWGFGIVVNGPLPFGQPVHVANGNSAVATLADTVATRSSASFASVLATGVAAGVDTVVATAPGFPPDTGTIVVGAGTSETEPWPTFDLAVGQEWAMVLRIVSPNGEARVSAVTKTFTLTAGANVEFLQDFVPITTVTVPAGQQYTAPFKMKGIAAGTTTVTISAPNYASVTRTVTVAP